ncbi:MAG: hypothetical protein HY048_16755 [Acidobacteria bacterium]|nr:hypothetical protein [Acidobacteriota bacterium]
MKTLPWTFWLLAGVFLSVQQDPPRKPIAPIEPVAAIVDAFKMHPVIGMQAGVGHTDARGFAFVIPLLRDPRIQALGVDVAMENGSARYQTVMDRYTRGEDVPYSELRHVWDDTTQPQTTTAIGDVNPIYRAVREINATLPRDRQMRALLGDPPIEWDNVHTRADFQKWLEQRDPTGAAVIQRESLAKGRHTLALYGFGHLQRRQQATNYNMDSPVAQTVISLLERSGVKTFIVGTGDETNGMNGWPVPSLAILRGTTLGGSEVPQNPLPRVTVQPDGSFVPIPREQWIGIRMEEQMDAMLYFGPKSTAALAPLSPTICSDPGYLDTRLARMALTGIPQFEADRLKQFCAGVK